MFNQAVKEVRRRERVAIWVSKLFHSFAKLQTRGETFEMSGLTEMSSIMTKYSCWCFFRCFRLKELSLQSLHLQFYPGLRRGGA